MHARTIAALLTALTLTLLGGCDSNTKTDAAPTETTSRVGDATNDADEPAVETSGSTGEPAAQAGDEMNGGDGAPNMMPSTPEDGEYTNTHSVLVEPDTDELDEVADCLTINVLGSGEVEFALELYFDVGHSCELSGEARPMQDGRLVYEGSAETEDAECELAIVTKGGTITLEEKGTGCSPVWCGMRGTLDGATFSQSTKGEPSGKCGT